MNTNLLKVLPPEPVEAIDLKTQDELIGRDATEKNQRNPPHFDPVKQPEVKHGTLKDWLRRLAK